MQILLYAAGPYLLTDIFYKILISPHSTDYYSTCVLQWRLRLGGGDHRFTPHHAHNLEKSKAHEFCLTKLV